MVNQDQYYTGASWEYVYADGSPGIGIFTSLCHPWGGAPTYILSNYILGIRREMNDGSSTFEWVVDPVWPIIKGLGLKRASGRVPLPQGGWIEADWSIEEGKPKCRAKTHNAQGVRVDDIRGSRRAIFFTISIPQLPLRAGIGQMHCDMVRPSGLPFHAVAGVRDQD